MADPELGADGIGVHLPSIAKHADVIMMTPWSRTAWIGTTWFPGNTISGYNASSAFPMPQGNYQQNPSSSQHFQHSPVNYMMPFPPEPIPPPAHAPVPSSQTTTSPGYPATLPVRPQKAWLTPPDDWKPGDGMFDINQLYSFSLPMTVANTPHNNLRDMSGMDIRDVRLVQVIHGATETICSREIRDVGRISHPHQGPALEYLFNSTAPIAAAQPAYLGKRPRQFAWAQP